MFNFNDGKLIAKVKGGKRNGKLLHIEDEGRDGINRVELDRGGKFIPVPDIDTRQVVYICGPSGSGKSTYAKEYIKSYLTLYPKNNLFVFSRTDVKDDPAYADIKQPIQIKIDESLVEEPIDITEEIDEPCIVLFDDVNTIHDDKIKKEIDKLIMDILEIGRKLDIYCVITSHLVIPNQRSFARTVLNECTSLTVFPRSGARQQIKYALKTYFGLSNRQIDDILDSRSRWITLSKTYPQYVLTEKEAYMP